MSIRIALRLVKEILAKHQRPVRPHLPHAIYFWQLQSRAKKDNNMSSAPIKSVFAAGNRLENGNFSGEVWLNMLVPAGATLPVANVTFAPGCRNSWHAHQGGQVLLVTAGRGYYQEWAKPARQLQAGDVVEIDAHVKHWHGAAKDSGFAHIAIEIDPQKGPAKWMEPVADEEYNALQWQN